MTDSTDNSNTGIRALEIERPIIEMEQKLAELEQFSKEKDLDLSSEIDRLKSALNKKTKEIFDNLTPWQRVQVARHPDRPEADDYARLIFSNFVQLHGDKCYRDDPSVLTGFGRIKDQKVLLIGQRKGKNLNERTRFNFGCPLPEGYRKALDKMKLAEKFSIPVVTMINTPGAHPGIEAEERGQFLAIAKNLIEMAGLRTIIIAVIIGEGGSGGALGIGLADRIAMLENTYYSVISPEGCAAILWKDAARRSEAAKALKLTAKDLKQLQMIDEVIPEPLGGAHKNYEEMAESIKEFILRTINEFRPVPIDRIIQDRYEKYRKIGMFKE
jgi:acetyl-CoA carboxylase carboxyl transferase subunit alpha